MRINIAIDGPSAAGKSTIAKSLAKQLNYIHLDTGAMYRSTAYKAVQNQISLEDENALVEMLKNTDITLTPEGKVFLDGEDVSSSIRTDQISLAASSVSKHPLVRSELVARQQKMAEKKGFIMDGRDIGTVVLKDANFKFFFCFKLCFIYTAALLCKIICGYHSPFLQHKHIISVLLYPPCIISI